MSLSASSKLNMARSSIDCRGALTFYLQHPRAASPVPVGLIQERRDVLCHTLLERGEAGVVPCPAQVFDLCLREILVLVADRWRHVDIFDVRRVAECSEHGGDQGAEALRLAGAYIEDSRHRRRLEHPSYHCDCVVHVDEVALLL